MLALTGSLRYYFVEGVTDMRLGQYRLCRVIEQLLHRNPYNGDVFIFMNKSRRVIKIIRYDNEAYILYVKALERDLKFMKIKSDMPVISQNGDGVHYQIKWKHLVLLLSCPVRSVIRI
jgi:transposase